jgi:hypothetical protein
MNLCFSGCDQLILKPEHISVNIMVAVYIQFLDTHQNPIQKDTNGMMVTIFMTRNGKDQLVFERVMQIGLCQATGDYELTEGQYIECTAHLKDENHLYTQLIQGYAKLTWDTVNSATNYGGVYNWYPKITIILQE